MSNTREIKFRAWNPKSKSMGVSFDLHDELTSNNAFQREGFWPTSEVFLQYTGLKDKNGVEIYEGDVVDVGDQQVTDMAHIDTLRVIKWAEDTPELTIAYIDGNTRTSGLIFNQSNAANHFKVIGNIYENPELLKVGDA